jgi:hypothetical protein
LTTVERDTLEGAIASHVRQAAIFDAVLRLIECARAEFGGDAVWARNMALGDGWVSRCW